MIRAYLKRTENDFRNIFQLLGSIHLVNGVYDTEEEIFLGRAPLDVRYFVYGKEWYLYLCNLCD